MLSDGRRLHLHHGPIDLIVEVWGPKRTDAYAAATERFKHVLEELVDELPNLRSEATLNRPFDGQTAQRMQMAVAPYAKDGFVTPMASVAGAVADEILFAMKAATNFNKAYVNNGGDAAFHLTGKEKVNALIFAPESSQITIRAPDPYRGVATSGWQGRSHSLGIADSVSVLASNAAAADVAATLIANAVDLPKHPTIKRTPAIELSPDSDLGNQLVTTGVGSLSSLDIEEALDRGIKYANRILNQGLIAGALLLLRSEVRHVGIANKIFIERRK